MFGPIKFLVGPLFAAIFGGILAERFAEVALDEVNGAIKGTFRGRRVHDSRDTDVDE